MNKPVITITLECHCGWTYRSQSLYYANQAATTHRAHCTGKRPNDLPTST